MQFPDTSLSFYEYSIAVMIVTFILKDRRMNVNNCPNVGMEVGTIASHPSLSYTKPATYNESILSQLIIG